MLVLLRQLSVYCTFQLYFDVNSFSNIKQIFKINSFPTRLVRDYPKISGKYIYIYIYRGEEGKEGEGGGEEATVHMAKLVWGEDRQNLPEGWMMSFPMVVTTLPPLKGQGSLTCVSTCLRAGVLCQATLWSEALHSRTQCPPSSEPDLKTRMDRLYGRVCALGGSFFNM